MTYQSSQPRHQTPNPSPSSPSSPEDHYGFQHEHDRHKCPDQDATQFSPKLCHCFFSLVALSHSLAPDNQTWLWLTDIPVHDGKNILSNLLHVCSICSKSMSGVRSLQHRTVDLPGGGGESLPRSSGSFVLQVPRRRSSWLSPSPVSRWVRCFFDHLEWRVCCCASGQHWF